jgi:hypothetical protein
MKACAVAWMRKKLALGDWSDYSGSYGKPGIIASTTAARGAAQFEAMEETLADFLETKSIVLNSAENVKVVDLASANPPFDPLVERMDRSVSATPRNVTAAQSPIPANPSSNSPSIPAPTSAARRRSSPKKPSPPTRTVRLAPTLPISKLQTEHSLFTIDKSVAIHRLGIEPRLPVAQSQGNSTA